MDNLRETPWSLWGVSVDNVGAESFSVKKLAADLGWRFQQPVDEDVIKHWLEGCVERWWVVYKLPGAQAEFCAVDALNSAVIGHENHHTCDTADAG